MTLVRVLLANGWEASITESVALAAGLTVLDKPALSADGRTVLLVRHEPPPPIVITDPDDDIDVWPMSGPPPETPPTGVGPGDVWIDVTSGDVYQLDAE